MFETYDTTVNAYVEHVGEYYDTTENAWVEVPSAMIYDANQKAWVEKLYKYLTVYSHANGSGQAYCDVTDNERRARVYMGSQADAISFVISNPNVKVGSKLKFTFENNYGKPKLLVQCRTINHGYYWSPEYSYTTEVEYVETGSLADELIGEIMFSIKCEQHDELYSYSSAVLKDIELGGVKYKFPQVTM